MSLAGEELLHVEERLWILTAPTDKAFCDFAFGTARDCRRPAPLRNCTPSTSE
ncbi:hypothetical protein LILAB_00135 [Corallococcus macrosporus]|uniref:Uncharacterized protein n=1 Tax=Myxococcus fulvus (strain ATCC BAA-855 / HW-1) TaxID=483219 RepID=F8C787_MYXFH|nr:hypothetical protein LILAB_00135 [Corallococcus macrosporus]